MGAMVVIGEQGWMIVEGVLFTCCELGIVLFLNTSETVLLVLGHASLLLF
jgi:hypothetical protein